MSIEFSTGSKYALTNISSTAVDRSSDWTICFWYKRTTDTGSFEGLASVSTGNNSRSSCWEFFVNGSTDLLYTDSNGGTAESTGFSTTTDTWYFAALTRVAGTPGTVTRWFGTDGTASVSSSASIYTSTAGLNNYLTMGQLAQYSLNLGLVGRLAHVRVWSSTLSQAQLEAEMVSPTAVISSGLLVAIEGTNSSDIGEDSGPSGFTTTYSASAPTYSSDSPSIVTSGTSVAPLAMVNFARMHNG